jgi:carboxymethylenebutenolidase
MCDQDHYDDDLKIYQERAALTRRQFGAVSVGVGMSMLLPEFANAQALKVTETDVTIKTPDGTCDAYFVHPATGQHPAVIVWPDILGLRTAFRGMGKRLAESGYSVLVVNPFYRSAKAPVVKEGATFADAEVKQTVFKLAGTLNPTTHVTDAQAFVAWLDTQKSVSRTRGMGTTGYCMGGPMVMRTTSASPRVLAGASFHGGGLVNAMQGDGSPHLQAAKTKAQFLIAIAENDDKGAPKEKDVLRETFGNRAEIEVYPAAHGWCPPDSMVYDKEQAEKAWSRLLVLFGKALA